MAIFENKATEQKEETKSVAATAVPADLRSVLIKPRISEKASKANQEGKYIFEISPKANKISVKKAVEKAFNVNVVSVNIVTMEGKIRNYGRRSGKMSDFKKAIVTLKKGQSIQTPEANI